ncbi:hypothetical protein DFS34DRAFT_276474 [Phlyctochytrium arcticum]|nr:hypothetical protein DFS34DRAFT_276474 [Phlyctochytrium arcticum]
MSSSFRMYLYCLSFFCSFLSYLECPVTLANRSDVPVLDLHYQQIIATSFHLGGPAVPYQFDGQHYGLLSVLFFSLKWKICHSSLDHKLLPTPSTLSPHSLPFLSFSLLPHTELLPLNVPNVPSLR